MIAALHGLVAEKSSTDAIIDVHGVGYRVYLSLLSLAHLPELGQPVKLRIRTVVREDAFDLFGFLSAREEELFLMLTSVSHVGPKMGMAVLSGLEVDDLVNALAKGDVARLTKIHGVGKKTAERLVLELKDKMKLLGAGPTRSSGPVKAQGGDAVHADLVSALVNLGYKEAHAEDAARQAAERLGEESVFEARFKDAMKLLRTA